MEDRHVSRAWARISAVSYRKRLFLPVAAAFAMLISACGGSSVDGSEAAESTEAGSNEAATPESEAEANLPLLESAENVFDIEVLNVTDGSIATLRQAVDGDRPVLLWFYAPH